MPLVVEAHLQTCTTDAFSGLPAYFRQHFRSHGDWNTVAERYKADYEAWVADAQTAEVTKVSNEDVGRHSALPE